MKPLGMIVSGAITLVWLFSCKRRIGVMCSKRRRGDTEVLKALRWRERCEHDFHGLGREDPRKILFLLQSLYAGVDELSPCSLVSCVARIRIRHGFTTLPSVLEKRTKPCWVNKGGYTILHMRSEGRGLWIHVIQSYC